MVKMLLLFILLLSQFSYAQDLSRDLDFIETQNTLTTPYSLPLSMNLKGEISILSEDSTSVINFNPLSNITLEWSKSLYMIPIQANEMAFIEHQKHPGWIEVKRERGELGLSLAATITKYATSFGFVPYKGARHVMIRHKKSQHEKTGRPNIPDSLEEIRGWAVNDQGSFQRYGGIQIQAGINYSVVSVLTIGLTIQNLFNIGIQRLKDDKVLLSIAEEDLTKRRLQSGMAIANAKLHFFKGKRLSTYFTLDLNDPYHSVLYKLAIKGKLKELQDKLPSEAQKMAWTGSERLFYFGIPSVIGKHFQRSEYEMNYADDLEEVLDMKSKRNAGFLIPLRNHNRMVYQTDSAITLFWYSEMNKAKEDVVSKHFLEPGRIMGAKGFENSLPQGALVGATQSQMGMSFTRSEIESVTPQVLEEILTHFENRCQDMNLKCAKRSRLKKITKKLKSFMTMKWESFRDKLGFLMIEEPALIHSYLKAIKSKKQVYFKFLNQKYQSLEGAALIEI